MSQHEPSASDDLFTDAEGRQRILRGVCIYSGAARLAELAVRLGFETVWIEMEHGPADFATVESICMAIEAGDGIPAVRVPDGQRHHVLRALEVGARIVIVPMVNTAQQAQQLVEFGKFPPLGWRGYNLRSRGLKYGLDEDPQTIFRNANTQTHLFAQIETMEAVRNLEEICKVPGLSGIFMGPGDLSASLGLNRRDAEPLIRIIKDCIQHARSAGKHAGILIPPGPLLETALENGADLVFYAGDVAELTVAWKKMLPIVNPVAKAARE